MSYSKTAENTGKKETYWAAEEEMDNVDRKHCDKFILLLKSQYTRVVLIKTWLDKYQQYNSFSVSRFCLTWHNFNV